MGVTGNKQVDESAMKEINRNEREWTGDPRAETWRKKSVMQRAEEHPEKGSAGTKGGQGFAGERDPRQCPWGVMTLRDESGRRAGAFGPE